jgi:hypothetical protein
MNDEQRQRLSRRLSGALGRKVSADAVEILSDTAVYLTDEDQIVMMARGNVCYRPGDGWFRNGRRLSEEEADRLLPRD